jgi:beta-glucosidase
MDSSRVKFPEDFLWGTSISAHQTEGFNVNDWSEWEHHNAARLAAEAEEMFASKVPDWEKIKPLATNPSNYISGRASDHYARYKEDIALIKQLGIKAFRFSIEWSRIEPKEGQYNQEAIDHYGDLINELKKAGIMPVVTLHHRTNPLWVRDQKDWQNKKTVDDFGRYVAKVVSLFKDDVKFWMPVNEPIMSLAGGYLGGIYPPGIKNIFSALKVFRNFVKAQNKAYQIIHGTVVGANVGLSHAAVYAEPYKNRFLNRIIVNLLHYLANHLILKRAVYDFIGVQYYSRGLANLTFGKYFLPKVIQMPPQGTLTDMGWEIYPEGLYRFIKDIAGKYRKPIYVTENGITDASDTLRADYIKQHLAVLDRAIKEGFDIRGYFYWAFLDNLEWDKGFWPRFGLIEVNYQNYERKIRPSGRAYSEIIKNSGF